MAEEQGEQGDRQELDELDDPTARTLVRLMLFAKERALPDEFRPFGGGLFEACTACRAPLQVDDAGYLVSKLKRGEEIIFELALCEACSTTLVESYSEATRQFQEDLFRKNGWYERAEQRLRAMPEDWRDWLGECAITRQPREEFDEYLIQALCAGDRLQVHLYPYVVGTRAIAMLNAGASQESRQVWDRFVGDHLELPPELRGVFLG